MRSHTTTPLYFTCNSYTGASHFCFLEGNGCQNPPPWPSWPTLNSDSTPYKSDITVGDVNSAEGSFTGTPEPPPTPQHHARKVKPPTCTTEVLLYVKS